MNYIWDPDPGVERVSRNGGRQITALVDQGNTEPNPISGRCTRSPTHPLAHSLLTVRGRLAGGQASKAVAGRRWRWP